MEYSLVCLPFAGGGAGIYRAWKDLPASAPRIVPVQLPGREEQFIDDLYRDVNKAADGLAAHVVELTANKGPVALFGHSLGAVLAFELARRLELDGHVDLRHLFVSGSPGPFTGRSQRATGLDDEQFLDRVMEFAGYQHDALDDPDMRELLLPVLRADVEMHENYEPLSELPLRIPITSVRGSTDELVSEHEAAEWESATSGRFQQIETPGGHMYLIDSPLPLLEAVARVLQG